ncbi:MAG TPA: NAD-glutamate dehydrogenase [Thermoanaerobaculia bacterium]|nr:NAD-glutamate dehydrogenase [Thermoanaerobaculia bacterium]
MSMTAEQRKADLIDRLTAEARNRAGAGLADSIEHFVRRYFAHVAPDDIIYTSLETLLGGALSLWELGAERKPGVPRVRLFNPSVEKNGWGLEHTVVEVVNDDMPFLVDSVSAEITRRDRKIHLLLHPVLRVVRDSKGKRREVMDTLSATSDVVVESYMHFEIDQETEAAELESIRKGIEEVLEQVRLAVADWLTMRERLSADIAEIEGVNLPMPEEEVEEARDFLRWLDHGNFIFLGYRRYGFETKGGQDYLPPVQGTGLGILREIRPESTQRGAEPLSREFSEYARRKDLLIITKANSLSKIHRPVPMDRIGIKRYDAAGNLIGEDRFLGLFASAAYSRSVRDIPMLRLKFKRTLDRAGLDPHSHNGKALVEILETFPRDEFLQITDNDLFDIARGILLLQERQRVALFVRKDVFERFVSCHVFVPRDRYTPDFKERARAILEEAFEGRDAAVYDQLTTSSALGRGLFVIKTTPGRIPDPDLRRVEAYLAEAARTWSDRLLDALTQARGEEAGIELHKRYKKAFPMAYQERFSAPAALYDLGRVEEVLATGKLMVDLYRHRTDQRQFHVKIIHSGDPVPLSELMPRLENMGVKVESEVPYEVQPLGVSEPVRIRDFSLSAEGMQDDLRPVKQKFQDTFIRAWQRDVENDGFNRLVLAAELEWHEIVILRAYCKYIRQIGVNLSEAYIQSSLANNPEIARMIVKLFATHFDPEQGPPALRAAGATAQGGRYLATMSLRSQISDALETVSNPDEDRILRLYVTLIEATLRTNYYQREANGERKSYVSFKFDSAGIRELPLPRPMFEIFVYAPFMEGIHLRAGKVARGGIRWSDRREDFRTEILGLMKAQNVKNVVIVPMGSKGGFVVKNPSADRETYGREGIASYKTLLRGMLDITDNLRGDEVIAPPDVVRRDPDDPYLVVAADKGTATFSDIANGVSAEYGFWLGDAFASGGSAGYDHKKMGITAKGAWISVMRHFREMGIDTQSQDFTVIGIGDMSGDVFGNGMLLSPHIRLMAAFDHRHIFIDPEPDAGKSFIERKRLFDLPRSSWADYDKALISKGGGVFERSAKAVPISPEMKRRFGLDKDWLSPINLMRTLLAAECDLLYFGGIGTYVKSADERHAEVGDRANDAIRVDGRELRAKVIAEGANLGMTQRGRVEYARLGAGGKGGRINTDAIDNSAGVDCSDHEVNIKILLSKPMAEGALTLAARNKLLAEMTDEVGELVLRDNYLQTGCLSVSSRIAPAALDRHWRFMKALEKAGRLDRAVEFLPDDEVMAERQSAGEGLTRPEMAVLLAYSKIALYDALLNSDLPDDPHLAGDLLRYFPGVLRERYRDAALAHRLRREIVATHTTNSIINRAGITFIHEVEGETGAAAADIARGYILGRDAFDLRAIWTNIEAHDGKVPAERQVRALLEAGRFAKRAAKWFLQHAVRPIAMAAEIERYRAPLAALAEALPSLLPADASAALSADIEGQIKAGFAPPLATRLALLPRLVGLAEIVRLANGMGGDPASVARVYFPVGGRFGLDWLRDAASNLRSATAQHWDRMALAAIVDDLYGHQFALTRAILASGEGEDRIEAWAKERGALVAQAAKLVDDVRAAGTTDLAMLAVANRQLRALVGS